MSKKILFVLYSTCLLHASQDNRPKNLEQMRQVVRDETEKHKPAIYNRHENRPIGASRSKLRSQPTVSVKSNQEKK